MTNAEQALRRLISHQGPVPVSCFMAEAMAHPRHGYYADGGRIGAAGDFITAPEISQMFGELIGLWLVDLWRRAGAPTPFRLVELGPGRGTLMADALRAARLDSGFTAGAELHLVEINRELRALQARALAGHAPRWHDNLQTVPEGAILLVANEFLDALPVRQFLRAGGGWRERLVGLAGGGFEFRAGPDLPPTGLAATARATVGEGAIIELGPAREALVADIALRIRAGGVGALLIDYGPRAAVPGDTLRAVKAHRHHPTLDSVGEADLSADVDFAATTRAAEAEGARVWGPVGQGNWLRALGIDARTECLADAGDPAAVQRARDRLCDDEEMGARFQVLALALADGPAPAGFPEAAR